MSRGIHFGDDVEPHHERIDRDDWEDVYVVGDVHGCRESLDRLLAQLGPTDDDLVVFVGDLVRKGPDSAGVVDLVRGQRNFLSVRGNNEEALRTGSVGLTDLDTSDLAYLKSLPVALSWDDTLVVHGGVHPDLPLDAQRIETLLTIRSPPDAGDAAWYETYEGPPRVLFGHTVHDAPVDREWAVGLDTGCVYGGYLTAYDVRRDRFVSVPAAETTQSQHVRGHGRSQRVPE